MAEKQQELGKVSNESQNASVVIPEALIGFEDRIHGIEHFTEGVVTDDKGKFSPEKHQELMDALIDRLRKDIEKIKRRYQNKT